MIIQIWSYEAVEGKVAEAMEVSKKLAVAHTKNGIPTRILRRGTGTAAELNKIVMMMEFESLAASEAYTDKGKEVDSLHKEARKYYVWDSLAHQYYKVAE
ncbi:MAG: hypothetical protein HN368_05575 [Spirochaetales bacterium]|jgi:hypothetical protein|nr:hypothetical protein [Spirochaetales bacterium]